MIRLFCIAFLALVASVQIPPPPTVIVRWMSPTSAEIRWTQHSNAERVCIHKNTPSYVLIECMASGPGEHVLSLPPPPPSDGLYWPQAGDEYYLTEQWETHTARYGPYGVGWWYWLPRFDVAGR